MNKSRKGRGKMFWGILLICAGILLLINYVFGLDLPIFKIIFSLCLIYLGFQLLLGSFNLNFKSKAGLISIRSETEAIFSETDFAFNSDHNKYSTVFGSSKLNLSSVDLSSIENPIEVNTVFGETEILIKKGSPYLIESHAAFASIRLPTKDINAFGQFEWKSENFKESTKYLRIRVNAVFASVLVKEIE